MNSWLPRHEQAAIVLLGMLLATWAFDRSGGDAAAFWIAVSIFSISIVAAWYARSVGD